RQVHDLADLRSVRLGQRAAVDREVLAEDEDIAAVDAAVTGDHAVAEDAVAIAVGRPRLDERVELDERTRAEEQLDSFPCGELAARVLLVDTVLSPTEERFRAQRPQSLDPFLVRRHGDRPPSNRLCARTAAIIVPGIAASARRNRSPDANRFRC